MRKLFLAMPLVALFLLAATVVPFPRLSVEQSHSCNACHISPSGGGARNEYGNHAVAFNELCLPSTKKLVQDKYKSPRLSESAFVGADIRYLIFDDGYLLRMQTDVYLTLEPVEKQYLHFRFGEDPVGKSGLFEGYGLLQFSKQKYWLKLGRFAPGFGLHNDDHKAYIRDRIGHGSNVYLDGFALGGKIAGVDASVEIMTENRRRLVAFNVLHTGHWKNLSCMTGFSYQSSEQVDGNRGRFTTSKAIYGGFNYDRFSLLGEIDFAGQANDTLIYYSKFITRLEYGLYLIGEYNFFDGNRDLKSGVDEFYRFSLELYPIPFFQLRPSYTRYTEGMRQDENEYFIQVHFGY